MAKTYGLGPEFLLEFAIEQRLHERTIYKGYSCFTTGAAAERVSESFSFEY